MNLPERAKRLCEGLTAPQKTWLQAAVALYRDKAENPYRQQIKAILDGEIPRSFDPAGISSKLLVRGEKPTPLGILATRPGDPVLEEMQRVALAVRQALVESAKESARGLSDVDAGPIEERLDLPPARCEQALDQLRLVGLSLRSRSRDRDSGRLETIGVDGDQFDAFYAFDGDIEGFLCEALFPSQEGNDDAPKQAPSASAGSVINPVFRSRIEHVDERLGFVIMPFNQEGMEGIYDEVIQPTLKAEGYRCQRADEVYGQIVMEDVWTKINEAGFVIADLTKLNPNVMYELGIVHTVGKPTVTITQEIDRLPFDVRHYRAHSYSNDAAGIATLKEVLRKAVPEALAEGKRRSKDGEVALRALSHPNAYVRPPFGSGLGGLFGR